MAYTWRRHRVLPAHSDSEGARCEIDGLWWLRVLPARGDSEGARCEIDGLRRLRFLPTRGNDEGARCGSGEGAKARVGSRGKMDCRTRRAGGMPWIARDGRDTEWEASSIFEERRPRFCKGDDEPLVLRDCWISVFHFFFIF